MIKAYLQVRSHTESICKPLQTEDYSIQPATFVSPPKWHLAHTTWFFEEFILKEFNGHYKLFDPDFSFLFNSYYNHVGERINRPDRGLLTRPDVEKVYAYRKYVDVHIGKLLRNNPSSELLQLVELGMQHEQQHQELLFSDIKYILGNQPNFPVYQKNTNLVDSKTTSPSFLKIEEGIYEIGYRGNGFCYDNELGVHRVFLQEFEISKSLVSNKEYLEFIESGGYSNFTYWHDEAWHWLQKNAIHAPLYWHKINGEWYYYTLSGLQKLQADAPLCHLSFYEAYAYAQWKEMRLPTEFEWETAAQHLNWGDRWEWTYSAYLPYPGFKVAKGAIGEYNAKFMVSQMVLRGASAASSPGHSRPTYRNFFHPCERWQFTGLRLVK